MQKVIVNERRGAKVIRPYIVLLIITLVTAGESLAMKVGTVSSIKSGDVIAVKNNSGLIQKIRLYGIDAPDSTQPFGDRSRQMLTAMTKGKIVTFKVVGKNPDGSLVASVFWDNLSINGAMVKAGYAWVSPTCEGEKCDGWNDYQKYARQEKRGLWQEADPVSPWKWREHYKEAYEYAGRWQKASEATVAYSKRSGKRKCRRKVTVKSNFKVPKIKAPRPA